MSGRAGATWSGRPQGPQRAPPPPRATTPCGYRPAPRRYRRPAGTAGPPEAGRPLVQGQACPSRSPCASSWVTRPKQVSRRGAACGRPRRGQASRQGVGGSVLARRLLVSAPRALRPDIGPSGRRCSASLTRTRCRTTRDRGGRRARGHLRAACFSFWWPAATRDGVPRAVAPARPRCAGQRRGEVVALPRRARWKRV